MKHSMSPWLTPFLVSGAALAAPQTSQPTDAELEARFGKRMTGSKMVGRFTLEGSEKPPQEETYTITKCEKVEDGRWRFDAKIEYGDKSVTVPLVLPVEWAGDTPMIQLTDMKIPMLGTYTARVLIYRDRYAGTWSGGDHGGHMFGRIVRADAEEPKAPAGGKAKSSDQQAKVWWSSWRGPNNTGVAPAGNPPIEWSEDRNVRWKVGIPGLGSSTPVIWGDRIYVTTAIPTEESSGDAEPAERPGQDERRRRGGRRGRGRFRREAPKTPHEFVVYALNRADGSVAWRTVVATEVPHEAGHSTASQASNSPVTDGEHVYAHFGSRGLYCLDMEGNVEWSKDFGQMQTRRGFGEGSSPALYGDTIVVNWDHEGDSFIAALDAENGDERWRTERDEITSWSTPLIVPVDGSPQVIVNATGASRGYDLVNGEVVWKLDGMTTNVIPTPAYADGIAYLMSGFRGAKLQAVRLEGARGELEGSDHVVWSHDTATSYVPSAVVYDDYIYFLRGNSGRLSCLDAKTGKPFYEGQRLDMREVYSSPVGVSNRVYITSRDGMTKVIGLGEEYEELATNELDDGFDASIVVDGDALYLRGRKNLYCIAASE